MALKQKLIIDKELTNSIKIIVRDETGLYSPSNITGYGGNNGNAIINFEKYIFELVNLENNVKHRQIQSDDVTNIAEYTNPTIARIINKENVIISATNFNLDNFVDSLYKLSMNVLLNTSYNCNAGIGTDVVTNVVNAAAIFAKYKYIFAEGQIYVIQDVIDNNIILDRNIVTAFISFKPLLSSYIYIIVSDELNDSISDGIANLSKNCNNSKAVNLLSEIQLYYWGMQRSLEANDTFQAFEYFKMAKSLACTIHFNHG